CNQQLVGICKDMIYICEYTSAIKQKQTKCCVDIDRRDRYRLHVPLSVALFPLVWFAVLGAISISAVRATNADLMSRNNDLNRASGRCSDPLRDRTRLWCVPNLC